MEICENISEHKFDKKKCSGRELSPERKLKDRIPFQDPRNWTDQFLDMLHLVVICTFFNPLEAEEIDLEVPKLRFAELSIMNGQDKFPKTGSVTLDANNYGKVLVNLCRSHVQTCKNILNINN